MNRRAFVAGVQHESSVFSPIPTPLSAFGVGALRAVGSYDGDGSGDMGFGPFALAAASAGLEVSAGPWSAAEPSQPASALVWATVRDAIVDAARAAGPVDIVFLMLHGAQIADGCDDCEGDLITALRDVVGDDVAIGVLLDLHANITSAMLQMADLVVTCREYPHVDYGQRAVEMLPLLQAIAERRLRPVTAAVGVPAPGVYATGEEPMVSFGARVDAMRAVPGVVSVSVAHGFEGSDTPDVGAAVWVTTDDDPQLAERLADGLARDFLTVVTGHDWLGPDVETAVDTALAAAHHPVVLADRGDNPGGGAAGDSTFVLSALLRRGDRVSLEGVSLALLWDPMAVDVCHIAGEGATVRLRIGGKAGQLSGPPVDVVARVEALRDDARQALFAQGPPRMPLGRSCSISVDGMRIVMNSERQQVFSPHVFSEHGIEPAQSRILVVKSTVHYLAGFGDLAAEIVRCDSPGSSSTDLASFPFERVARPLYPLDPVDESDLRWILRAAP